MQFTPSKIDWKAATATKPPEILPDVPPGIARKNMVRRTAMFKAAADVIPCIPAPGESFHCLLNGRYDFMVLLATILGRSAGHAFSYAWPRSATADATSTRFAG